MKYHLVTGSVRMKVMFLLCFILQIKAEFRMGKIATFEVFKASLIALLKCVDVVAEC